MTDRIHEHGHDYDHDPAEGSNGPAAPGGRTAPVTESHEHGDSRELLGRRTESGTGDDGFEWCETAGPTDGGFEWCEPAGDGRRSSTAPDGSRTDPAVEPDPESRTEAETEPDGAETDPEGERYSLPRDLVTTTRVTGADDEAVALLSTLKRDPDGGRWRRAATEHGDE